MSHVCCEIDSTLTVERDVSASLVVLNEQNQAACERHAEQLERFKLLQEIQVQVTNNPQPIEGPIMPPVITSEHRDDRHLLMKDVEEYYLRAVNVQAEMMRQRELMAQKSRGVAMEIANDCQLIRDLEVAMDLVITKRQSSENALRQCSMQLESSLLRVADEVCCVIFLFICC